MPARKKNTAQANAPHSAPHTAPSPQPAPAAGPPPGSPAAAIWAALTAAPGATATQIATAAGTSRATASRELAALETSGQATRTPGERTGRTTAPTTWQPAHPGPGQTDPDATAGTPGTPTAGPAPAGDGHLPAPGSDPAPGEAGGSPPDTQAPGSTATDAPAASKTAPAPADSTAPGDDAAPDAGIPDDSAADAPAGDAAAPAPADGEPQPAAGEAAELLRREVASAATQAADVLGSGDTATALAAMDAICAAATQARRLLKAAASGRKARGAGGPAARPGQLRDLVAAHLAANPDAEFTPHAIGRVLARSSGAVANALDRLTALGHAQLTTDKPRRYRHQATPGTTPAPASASR
jgi:hypothetical protein